MDFLKEILGEQLFAQVAEKINAHNGNEANKGKQIKLANLGGGEYVSKAKHDALQVLLDGKTTELETANGLIADFKKSAKGNEDLQGKITDYEARVQQLQAELQQTKVDSAINVGLLAAGVKPEDVDYVTFKLKAKGEIELDDQGNIKGWDDKVAGLKTQFPANFASTGGKKYEEHKLPDNNGGADTITKEEFNKMGYNSRVELKRNNPEQYSQLMKG